MHISKLILLIFSIQFVFAQSNILMIDSVDTLQVQTNNSILDELNGTLINSDEIGDYFKLEKIISDSVFKYDRYKNIVVVDTLIAKNDEIRIPVFDQICKSVMGTKPFKESDNKFKQIVSSYSFLTDSSTIQYGLYDNEKLGAVINLKSNFNNYFSGIIGASNEDNKWSVNGQIDIHLENQWRTANLIDLHWERLRDESQILEIMMEEPHPFGLPLGVGISFNQDLREGNYIDNESAAGIIKTVPGLAKFGFGGKTVKINTTTQGDSLGISNLNSQLIYVEANIDKRNDYWLPSDGYYLNFNADVGNRTVSDSSSISVSLYTDIEKYFKITSRINILINLNAQGIWLNDAEIHDGEMIRYGGVNSMRGYAEDNFKSDWVVLPSFEINWNIGSQQKFILFTDLAIQDDYQPLPYGIGLGLTQVTKNSVLKLYYGVGRGDKIKNGKIHLQFLTKL